MVTLTHHRVDVERARSGASTSQAYHEFTEGVAMKARWIATGLAVGG